MTTYSTSLVFFFSFFPFLPTHRFLSMDSEFEGLKNQIYRIRYFFFVIFQFSNPTGLNTLVGTEFFNSRNLFINYNIKGTTRGKKRERKQEEEEELFAPHHLTTDLIIVWVEQK